MTGFDDSNPFADLFDRLLGTEKAAGATAMTELREDEDGTLDYRQGMISANLGAFAAIVAAGFVDLGDELEDLLALLDLRLQEKMSVGLFDIAIQKLNRMRFFQRKGKVDRNGRFSCSAFSAGHRDNHKSYILFPTPTSIKSALYSSPKSRSVPSALLLRHAFLLNQIIQA
jgi:hypothetical protein